MAVVTDLGREPELERWRRPSDMVYESVDEIVEVTGRRLVLPRIPLARTRTTLATPGRRGAGSAPAGSARTGNCDPLVEDRR